MGRFSQQIGASCLLNLYDVQYCIAGLKYKGISVINDQMQGRRNWGVPVHPKILLSKKIQYLFLQKANILI